MGRTANHLMSTWVLLPPGLIWTATVSWRLRWGLVLVLSVMTVALGVLNVAMWLKLSWRDHRLAWDPSQYNDINIIRSVNTLSLLTLLKWISSLEYLPTLCGSLT